MKTFFIILYPFLFLIAPILKLWYKNYAEVSISLIYKLFGYYILSYAFIYCSCLYFMQHDYLKTSLILFLCAYIFNDIYSIYKKLKKGKHFCTRMINGLLLGLVVMSPLAAFFIPVNVINVLSKVLLAFSTLVVSVYSLGILSLCMNRTEEVKKDDTEESVVAADKKLPDIYYIIPDTYIGNSMLKKYYDYDNTDFTKWLEDNHFKIYENAKTNYPITNISLSSTLNMDYLENYFKYNEDLNPKNNLINHQKPHFQSKVAKILKANGYKYYHLLNYWEKQMHSNYDIADISLFAGSDFADFIKVLYSESLIRNIIRYFHRKNLKHAILSTFEELEQVAIEESDKPKFVMAHLICPHGPFFFDKEGKVPDKKLDKNKYEDYKILFINQLQYLNIRLKEIISKIQKNNKDAIILIQADHGGNSLAIKNPKQWQNPEEDFIEERYCILRAIYSKDIDLNCISSVNVFRCILNSVLGTNYEMLPDKYMFANYDNRLKTYDVSDKVNMTEKIKLYAK